MRSPSILSAFVMGSLRLTILRWPRLTSLPSLIVLSPIARPRWRTIMGLFKRTVASHLVPVHRHNVAKKDWVVLLEAGTIVGPSPERLRVARATQERRIVKKYNIFLRARHYLVVDGYDPRI